jgi:hypothetical protein
MTKADNYDVKVVLDDGLDPVTETENPFAVQSGEGVQVASVGGSLKGMLKGLSAGSEKSGAQIKEDFNESLIPTSSAEDADELLRGEQPTEAPSHEPGLPSAEDITQRNINFNNLDTDEDVLHLIDTASQQADHSYNTTRRGTITHDQTRMSAEIYAEERDALTELLGRKPGDAFNATQVTVARNLLVDSAEQLQKLAREIADGGGSDTDILKFRQAVARHSDIQAQVSGMTAEAGRALNAFKIPAQGGKVRTQQIKEIVESSGGTPTARKLAEIIANAENPEAVSKATRTLSRATGFDMLLEYWINNLLSALTTHVVNLTGNALALTWSIPERFLAAGIRKARRSPDGVRGGEAVAQLYGLVKGFEDGLRVGWLTLKTGEPSDPMMKVDARKYRAITAENVSKTVLGRTRALGVSPEQIAEGGPIAWAIDMLGEGIRLPGRALGAEDEFYKSIGYRMELNAQAYRTARLEGLEGDELAQRIQFLIEHPTEDIHISADTMARYNTFTKPLGSQGQKAQAFAAEWPAARLIMPFIRTPINILKYVGERTPVAWLHPQIQADILAGGAKSDIALSRMALGSMLLVSGGMLGWEGKVTGNLSGPARKAMIMKGIKPNSIKIGDQWYSLNRLDPMGAFFTMSADVAQIVKYSDSESDIQEVTAAVAHAVSKGLLSKTYLRGVSDVLSAINSKDAQEMERVLMRYPATFLPASSMLNSLEKVVDPTLRETFTLLDTVKSRTPGLSDDLPPVRDMLTGYPVVYEGGLGPDIASPVYSSTEKESIVLDEIINLNVDLRRPRKWIESGKRYKIDLSPWEYDSMMYTMTHEKIISPINGKPLVLEKYLEQIIKGSFYKSSTPMAKANAIKSVFTQFHDMAKGKLIAESPELRAKQAKSWDKKAVDMTGKGIPADIQQQYITGGQ